jgi:ribosome biogenesis GTPase
VLARRAAGGDRRAQPIAANVDQVVVVAATRDPEPSPRMLDRLFVIAEANGLPGVLVVNKTDLDRTAAEALGRRYAAAAYQVLATSVQSGEGLAAFRDLLRGRESVLAGPSGVGKSSLLNAIEPGLGRRVGEISEKWRTGRHTTSAAELLPLAIGGFVVDTPGIREVGTWGLDADALAACFPEFRPYLDGCRFDNCRHLTEPGCAVRAAAATGRIDADRLGSYERLYAELNVPSWSTGRRRAT